MILLWTVQVGILHISGLSRIGTDVCVTGCTLTYVWMFLFNLERWYDDIMIIKWPLFFGIQPPGLLLVLCSQIVANHHGRKLRLYIYITVVRREPEATKTLDFMGHRGYELSKNLRFRLGHWWSWQLGRSFRQCGLIATSKIWGVYHGFLPCLTMFYPSG